MYYTHTHIYFIVYSIEVTMIRNDNYDYEIVYLRYVYI